MSKRLKALILLGLPVVLGVIFSLILQVTILAQPEKITAWLESFGPFVILVYIVIQTITIVVPPIGGFFIYIALIAIYEPFPGLLIVYFVTNPLYILNFYLAKRYGRPLVEKVVGKSGLKRIDGYAEDAGTITLIVLKIFQNGLYDYISYAAGLTKISFKTFALINFIAGIPAMLVSYFILTAIPNFTLSIVVLLITSYIFIAVSVVIKQALEKYRKSI